MYSPRFRKYAQDFDHGPTLLWRAAGRNRPLVWETCWLVVFDQYAPQTNMFGWWFSSTCYILYYIVIFCSAHLGGWSGLTNLFKKGWNVMECWNHQSAREAATSHLLSFCLCKALTRKAVKFQHVSTCACAKGCIPPMVLAHVHSTVVALGNSTAGDQNNAAQVSDLLALQMPMQSHAFKMKHWFVGFVHETASSCVN